MLVFDAAEPGFGVRVTSDKKRVFLFQYRVGGTSIRRYRIGVWGEGSLSAAKARREAEKLRGMVQAGRDPVAERQAAEAEAERAARTLREQTEADAFTFEKLVGDWIEKGIAHRRPSYRRDAENRLKTYCAKWLKRPAGDITKADVVRVIDEVERDRGVISARRGLAYGRACYGWAVKRDKLSVNPFQGVPPPGKENPRDRVLTDTELGAIWSAAIEMGDIAGAYIRTLLLTLQRREEVAGMTWAELSPDGAIWTIPAARAKNGRAHVVHLPQPVQDILSQIPRQRGVPFVFARRRKNSIGAFSTMKVELLKTVARAEGRDHSKITATSVDWRFHDFRRTGVTALAGRGIPPHVADKLLNHITGAIQGVAAVYQRAEFLAERKHAMDVWAEYVLGCGNGSAAAEAIPTRRNAGGGKS